MTPTNHPPAGAGAPDLSVVVPTYKRPDLLVRCLEALAQQSLSGSQYEVVVVDDGSGPETAEVLGKQAADWTSLRWFSQVNSGPATARNRGVEQARGRIILFVDDDIIALPNLLETHLKLHENQDDNFGVIGLVSWHPDLEITSFMRWLDTKDYQFGFAFMSDGPVDEPWRCFYTCNLSMKRRTFLESGGFDVRFPYPAHEDTELAIRLWKRGFHLEYDSSARAWHARGVTLSDFARRMHQAGESAAMLSQLHPEMTSPPLLGARDGPAWKRVARRMLPIAAAAVPLPSVRGRYYDSLVNAEFRKGLREGQRRIGGGVLASQHR